MKLLFIATRPPCPPLKGDQVILFNRIKHLHKDHSITLLCFIQSEKEKQINKEIENYCERIIFVKHNKIVALFYVLFGFIFSNLPLQVLYYKSKSFSKELNKLLMEDEYDIIHCYLLRIADHVVNFQERIKKPKCLELIDSMILNFSRRAELEKFPMKLIFKEEVRRLEKYERNVINNFDSCIVVSDIDKKHINNEKIICLPLGIDTDIFYPASSDEKPNEPTIVFSGNLGYFPNENAILWFIQNCFPQIVAQIPNVKLKIVGSNASLKLLKHKKNQNIYFTGYVSSIAEELRTSTISIAPMQSGSGMQFKILEAMACGLPVVCTPLGLGAIKAQNEKEIFVANSKGEFIQQCAKLLLNQNLTQKTGHTANFFITKHYSWNSNISEIESIYQELLSPSLL